MVEIQRKEIWNPVDTLMIESMRRINDECEEYMDLWIAVEAIEDGTLIHRDWDVAFDAWSRYSARKVARLCRRGE